jgi:hypothetical protein
MSHHNNILIPATAIVLLLLCVNITGCVATTQRVVGSVPDTNVTSANTTNTTLTLSSPFWIDNDKTTGQRVLDVNNPSGPTLETSFSDFGAGIIKGVGNATTIGTIITSFRPGGALYSQGKGVTTTDDGEIATWTEQGIGHFTKQGMVVFHGIRIFSTSSTEKLAFLNNLVGVLYTQADIKSGIATNTIWELK